MIIKPTLLVAILSLSLVGIIGCGDSGPKPEDKQIEQVATEMEGMGKAARAAGGDFEKLSQADKDKFMARVNGDQNAAVDMVKRMAGGGGTRGGASK